MTIRNFLIVGGAIAVGYGIAFLIAPQLVFTMYGLKSDPAVVLGYRYFGVALLGVGLLCWALKDCRDHAAVRAALLSLGVSDVAGVIVSAWGALNGQLNAFGWLNVLLYVALAAGAFYLSIDASAAARRPA